jgi:hypothetical protein
MKVTQNEVFTNFTDMQSYLQDNDHHVVVIRVWMWCGASRISSPKSIIWNAFWEASSSSFGQEVHRSFVMEFARVCHWIVSSSRQILIIQSINIHLHIISHRRLGFPSGLFPSNINIVQRTLLVVWLKHSSVCFHLYVRYWIAFGRNFRKLVTEVVQKKWTLTTHLTTGVLMSGYRTTAAGVTLVKPSQQITLTNINRQILWNCDKTQMLVTIWNGPWHGSGR